MLEWDVAAELPYLRAQAESLMVDEVTVERPTGESTPDPVTLEQVPVYAQVYSGKGRVQRTNADHPTDQSSAGSSTGRRHVPRAAAPCRRRASVRVTG